MGSTNFAFTESGLIFSIKTPADLQKIKFSAKDFKHHGPAFAFLFEYIDQHETLPAPPLLKSKFVELDLGADGAATLEYFLTEFKKQLLYRKTVDAINTRSKKLLEKPDETLKDLVQELESLSAIVDDDVVVYDSGESTRATEYSDRVQLRKSKMGVVGIPTPFVSLNSRGVGWLPGDLVSMFARPTVGKSWMSVKCAAIGARAGYKTILVTSEMPTSQMSLRLDVVQGNMAGYRFSHKMLKRGDSGVDLVAYKKFLSESNKKSTLIVDHISDQAITVAGISSLVRKHNPSLVIVDGAYLFFGDETQMWEKNNALFQGLKNLAVSKNIVVVASTQATRKAADLFKHPTEADIAFGDGLIRASDMAFSMCKVKSDDKLRSVLFHKIRDDEDISTVTLMKWNVDIGDISELVGSEAEKDLLM